MVMPIYKTIEKYQLTPEWEFKVEVSAKEYQEGVYTVRRRI